MMNEYKQKIIDELESVIAKIQESQTIQDQLYYFSATYGIMNHIMNIEMNTTLVFIHQIMKDAYNAFNQRFGQPKEPNVESVEFPLAVWNSLLKLMPDLVEAFKTDDKIREIMEKVNLHSYINTGNGFYNYKKGSISLNDLIIN